MESSESPQIETPPSVRRIAAFVRYIYGKNVRIIDDTTGPPHELPPDTELPEAVTDQSAA